MLLLPFEVDPNSVRAGWLPLLLIIGIGVAIGLLYLSMRREMRRIAVPTQAELEAAGHTEAAPARVVEGSEEVEAER